MTARTPIKDIVILLLLGGAFSACGLPERTDENASSRATDGAETTELHRFEYKQVHMGVQARIVLYAPDTVTARAAAAAAFDRIAELDGVMSDYRVDSELMELVRRAGEGPVRASDDLFEVLSIAQRISEQSNGAFDVTIGPIVQLWRQARRDGRLPSQHAIDAALDHTGSELLVLDARSRTVELRTDSMRLDLGGIAKGYAADKAIEVLRRHGISRAMVEFGGDTVVGDPPPGESGWTVTAAVAGGRQLHLANEAVSSSADTQQFVEISGTRYSHVVDPRTGLGLTTRVAATVIAPQGVLSDALATALSVMGRDDGLEMIAREYPEIEAHIRSTEL